MYINTSKLFFCSRKTKTMHWPNISAEVQSDALFSLIRNYFSYRSIKFSSVKWSSLLEICMPIWVKMQVSLFISSNAYLLSDESALCHLFPWRKDPQEHRTILFIFDFVFEKWSKWTLMESLFHTLLPFFPSSILSLYSHSSPLS